MKTLAVRQPWATLIAEGTKTTEVRTWRTAYRGELLIVASGKPCQITDDAGNLVTLPTQIQVCTVTLTDCRPLTPADYAAACLDDWHPDDAAGHYAWQLSTPRHVTPAPHRGRLNLYRTPAETIVHLLDGQHFMDYN